MIYIEQGKFNQQNMKTTSKLNYTLYFIAINLALWSTISCKKYEEAGAPTNLATAPTQTPTPTPTPPEEPPVPTLVMTPAFTNNKLIRYKQKSLNSCLITSIYMLVRSMNDATTVVNESETEYKFDGSHNKNVPDEAKLATDNALIYHQIFTENTLSITQTAYDYTYSDFKNTVNTLAGILKIGPFVLGASGHAILAIGIEKQSGTLIYVDPMNPNINKSCSIFNPFLVGISELYYPNTYVKQPAQHYTPTKKEEDNFQKLKSDGAKKEPEVYKP